MPPPPTLQDMRCPLNTKHAKDRGPDTKPRKFNTQVGDLFHDGMGQRDPKARDWKNPASPQHPHRSHQAFTEKKVKHQTHHHASPNCKSGFDPISTHCRTLEVGRPATGGRTDANARPQPGTRPTTAPCGTEKFRSQQELSVLKRRHMTDLDGQTTGVLEGWKQNCPPPSRATATGRQEGWSTQKTAQRSPAGELNVSAGMPAAGVELKGSVDIMAMEPVADHIPHTSYQEFNLKKQQHFTGLHKSPNSTRFAR